MSRKERNGGDMVGNGGKWWEMQKYDGKCRKMCRNAQKDGERRRKENDTRKSVRNGIRF